MNEYPRSYYEHIIDEWIFNERDRAIMKRKILDGITYERLAEEFDMSVRGVAHVIERNRKIILKHI